MNILSKLQGQGVRPSAQRVAVAEYVLRTRDHPSAQEVWSRVRGACPVLSRATVYNTLQLFVQKGLLRELILAEGKIVYDPCMQPHHHFVDDATGTIFDVPWEAVQVGRVETLEGFDVREYQVVMRGRKKPARRR